MAFRIPKSGLRNPQSAIHNSIPLAPGLASGAPLRNKVRVSRMNPPGSAALSLEQSDEEFVTACFRLLLRRKPDEPGLRHFLNGLGNGMSRLEVVNAFLNSPEYAGREDATFWVPAGHFYSPYPSRAEVAEFGTIRQMPEQLTAIDLQDAAQLKLMEEFARFYPDLPFQNEAVPGLRYKYINTSYPPGDSIPLYCMIRHLAPKRFIEVGCGNSSCVTLDTNDRHFQSRIELTFIEPYPAFFNSLIRPEEQSRVRLLASRLQDVPVSEFERLEARDILFIDSTHVSKLNSDVNYFLFEIFPRLKKGVYIHIHDIFYPFEYPKAWLEEGRAWNEQYILRAFLELNDHFEIRFFNTYLFWKHPDWFRQHMPKCLENPGGSIWLEKVR